VIDAGDIMQSLNGITVIGRGDNELSFFYKFQKEKFSQGIKERTSASGALREAENNLSMAADMKDCRRIMCLVSAPKDVLSVTIMDEIAGYLQEKAPKAIIRIGDYPRRDRQVAVTLTLSELTRSTKIEQMNQQAEQLFNRQKELEAETKEEINKLKDTAKNLPNLA